MHLFESLRRRISLPQMQSAATVNDFFPNVAQSLSYANNMSKASSQLI